MSVVPVLERSGRKEGVPMVADDNKKVKIALGGLQEALLLPLWGRAKENEKKNPLLRDAKVSEIIHKIDYDFSKIEKVLTEFLVLNWNISSRYCDGIIRKFITEHPKATVVNVGAGLDTTFYRVNNGSLRWYDLDLPDVIELRKKLVPETDRSKCIAKSVFDFSWFEDIGNSKDGLFMFARGVFFYFDVVNLKRLFSALAMRFSGAEMIFNSVNVIGRWAANHLAFKRVGIRVAPLRWAIGAAKQLTQWDDHIQVIDEWPMFSRVPKDPSWERRTIIRMTFCDRFKCLNMIHLRFK
jgi:O-methyltransferase involved in polyketide biosynthesis